ncbi:MAG: purine-nucleoside phosphorylase [Chitinophagaceae bacterium]|nr:MAG: purine-nucleoside phosphorylase [Chitinophagaceae bacterium]
MEELFDKIQSAASFIRQSVSAKPEVGIVLGTGLGGLADTIAIEHRLPYRDIPYFPQSTVMGHSGELLSGEIGGKKVLAMSGRFHFYEGYSMQEVTFPIRVMKALGINTLMVSNAAGGMNAAFKVGDIMIIRDHINLMPEHPLRGKNDERLGVRFPDMSEPYSRQLIAIAEKIAREENLDIRTGVYAGVQGPTFETKAEYEYLHRIGADAVGMSTVPEVIVAVHAGLKVFALSIITDLGIREDDNPVTHEEVLAAASAATPKMTKLFQGMIGSM